MAGTHGISTCFYLFIILISQVIPGTNCLHASHHVVSEFGRSHLGSLSVDFVSTRLNSGGDFEVRISYDGTHAMETVVPELGEHGLFYRIVTNGKQIVTSIYKSRNLLIDCDVSRDQAEMDKFYLRFLGGASEDVFLPGGNNVTVREIYSFEDLDIAYRPIVELSTLRVECRDLHRYLRRQLKERQRKEKQKSENSVTSAENDATSAEGILYPLYNQNSLYPLEDEDINQMIATALESQHASRQKRAMLIYPGTNWCGTGNTAESYHDLGDNHGTDKCCRTHDHCPYTIDGFTTKYNLFNYRFHTLSHCACDQAFKNCLKRQANSISNEVGSIFFNVVGLKCFTLNPEKACIKRTWWGNCLKYQRQYRAVIEEPLQY